MSIMALVSILFVVFDLLGVAFTQRLFARMDRIETGRDSGFMSQEVERLRLEVGDLQSEIQSLNERLEFAEAHAEAGLRRLGAGDRLSRRGPSSARAAIEIGPSATRPRAFRPARLGEPFPTNVSQSTIAPVPLGAPADPPAPHRMPHLVCRRNAGVRRRTSGDRAAGSGLLPYMVLPL